MEDYSVGEKKAITAFVEKFLPGETEEPRVSPVFLAPHP
jgi:hypothetical protein